MDDWDVLAQKFLNDDLSLSESSKVDELLSDQEFMSRVEAYRLLQGDLKKHLFLQEKKKALKTLSTDANIEAQKTSKKWLYIAASIAVLIGIFAVFNPFNRTEETLAMDNSTHEHSKDSEDSSVENIEKTEETLVSSSESNIIDVFKDEDIIENGSVFNFNLIETVFDSIQDSDQGIISAIIELNNLDETYILNQSINDSIYVKSLTYLGETKDWQFVKLVSYVTHKSLVRRSLLVFNKDIVFEGRYILNTIDHLPDYIKDDKLIIDVYNFDGNRKEHVIEISKPLECIDLPDETVACPSKF